MPADYDALPPQPPTPPPPPPPSAATAATSPVAVANSIDNSRHRRNAAIFRQNTSFQSFSVLLQQSIHAHVALIPHRSYGQLSELVGTSKLMTIKMVNRNCLPLRLLLLLLAFLLLVLFPKKMAFYSCCHTGGDADDENMANRV